MTTYDYHTIVSVHGLFWIHGLLMINRSSFKRTNSSIILQHCCCNILHCMSKYSSSDTESIFQVCEGPMVTLRSVCTHNVTILIMQQQPHLYYFQPAVRVMHACHMYGKTCVLIVQIKVKCHLVPSVRTNLVNSEGKVLGIAGLGRSIDQPSEEVEAN